MRAITSCIALIAAIWAFPSIAFFRNGPDELASVAKRGEIFAEIYADPFRLNQIENEVVAKGWRIDCSASFTLGRFVRVRLPINASYNPDIRYFIDLGPTVWKVQMVYETMPKEPCVGQVQSSGSNAPGASSSVTHATEQTDVFLRPGETIAGRTERAFVFQVKGMPVEIRDIRAHALEKGWKIACQGTSREARTIRLEVPSGTSRDELSRYLFDVNHPLGSESREFDTGQRIPESCDEKPDRDVVSSKPGPEFPQTTSALAGLSDRIHKSHILSIGPPDMIAPLATAARECDLPGVRVRSLRRKELAFLTAAQAQWVALTAGKEVFRRGAMLSCLLHRGQAKHAPPRIMRTVLP